MSKIRAALVGFGGMGQQYARMIYHGMVPGMALAGVCCRNAAGKALLEAEFPGVHIYPDVDDMALHAEEFDAAIIVTPHASHIPIALKMAGLGKHLLLDKPAGISAGEVEQLILACQEKKLAFAMMFNNRRLPVFHTAKEFLASGSLGQLHRAVWVCNNWYRSPAYHRSAGWRSSWKGEGGGLLINQNQHYLDMWQWLFGMPKAVYASMEFGRYNDFSVDDAVDIQLFHENGFHGTMISATGESPGVNRLEIWGTKGRLTLENGNRLTFDENTVPMEVFAATNEEKFASIPHTLQEIPLPTAGIPYAEVLANFADHLLRGTPLYADGMDGLRAVQLTNACYVSSWQEKKVTLPVAEEAFLSGLKARQEAER